MASVGDNIVTMEQIRAIEWSKDHLWDVRLLDQKNNGPGAFTDWFPATSVRENIAAIQNETFERYLSSYSIPKQSSEFTIDVTFVDDADHSITTWIADWINEGIFNGSKTDATYVTPVNNAWRFLHLRKLAQDHHVHSEAVYLVVPDGDLDFEGHSEAGTHEYSMTFKVIGGGEV